MSSRAHGPLPAAILLIAIIVGCAGVCALCSCFPAVPLAASLLCLVIAISDGDTLTVRCGASSAERRVKVRIAAIDAPESRQAFGQKSRQSLSRLCMQRHATLRPVEKDSYGRTVAHVRCGATDVAAAQVRAGLAWVYTPHAGRYPHLAALQRQARASNTGLWSQRRPLAPWEYRHRRQNQQPPR